jgi:hypothetical protein
MFLRMLHVSGLLLLSLVSLLQLLRQLRRRLLLESLLLQPLVVLPLWRVLLLFAAGHAPVATASEADAAVIAVAPAGCAHVGEGAA